MKFKQKFIGWLGSAVIATTAIAAVASCSFRRHPAGEYDLPTVDFSGNNVIAPNSGVKTGRITGFTFSRPLYTGEEIEVKIIDPQSLNSKELSGTANYAEGEDEMSIDVSIDIPEEEKYFNKSVQFNIQLIFTYDGKTYDPIDVPCTEPFRFDYSAAWEVNTIDCSYSAPYSAEYKNQKVFSTEADFKLRNELKTGDEYKEKVHVSSNNSHVEVLGWSIDKGDKKTIHVDLKLVGCSDYSDDTETFNLIFNFEFRGQIMSDYTYTSPNLSVNYDRIWEDNYLIYDNQKVAFLPAPGQTSANSAEGTFTLHRELRKDEKLGINETLKLEITSAEFKSNEPLSKTYTIDDLYINPSVTGKSVVATLSLDVATADIQKDISVSNITIKWTVGEEKEEFYRTENCTGLEFNYRAKMYKYGINTGFSETNVNQLKPDVSQCGNNGYTINSIVDGEVQANAWFAIDRLDEGHKLDDIIEEQNGNVTVTAVNPQDPTDPEKTNIQATGISRVIKEENGKKTEYLNFGVKFKKIIDESKQQTEQFNLIFTFSKEDYSYPVALSHTFELFYEPKTYTENYIPYMDARYGDEVEGAEDDVESPKHGDSIIHVVATIKSPLGKTGTLNSITVSNSDQRISLLKGTGEYADGWKLIPAGAGEDHDTVDMYVQINTDKIGDNEFDGFSDHDYSCIFTYNFTQNGSENVIYEKTCNSIIHYIKFSSDPKIYVRSRTVPINLRYKTSTGTARTFGTAWALAKAPKDGESKIDPNAHCFYIVTSKQFRDTFNAWLREYYQNTSFNVGVTDYSLSQNYTYYSGGKNHAWNNRCYYEKDYAYCKLWDTSGNRVGMVYDKDSSGSDKNYTFDDGYCDIAVAKVDFGQMLQYLETEQTTISDRRIIAYVNKLNTLNNFYKQMKHVNEFIDKPIGSGVGGATQFSDYSSFTTGGYPWEQKYVDKWETQWSCTYYDTLQYTPSQMKYETYSQYKTNETTSYPDDDTNLHIINSYDDTKVSRGAPVYYVNASYDKFNQYMKNASAFGSEDMWGGMMVAQSKTAVAGINHIYVAGVFRTYQDISSLSTWSSGSNYLKYYPYFDIFNDGTTNLLKPYIDQE